MAKPPLWPVSLDCNWIELCLLRGTIPFQANMRKVWNESLSHGYVIHFQSDFGCSVIYKMSFILLFISRLLLIWFPVSPRSGRNTSFSSFPSGCCLLLRSLSWLHFLPWLMSMLRMSRLGLQSVWNFLMEWKAMFLGSNSIYRRSYPHFFCHYILFWKKVPISSVI